MNKLIMFPLFIMTLITLIAFFGFGVALPSDTNTIEAGYWLNNPAGSEIYYWHDSTNNIDYLALSMVIADEDGYYNPYGPYEESPFKLINTHENVAYYYDGLSDFYDKIGVEQPKNSVTGIFNTPVFWGFVIGGLVAATAFGFNLFGSGLSEYSQRLVFIGLIYAGVWVFMTISSSQLLNDEALYPFGWLIYSGLTLMFIFGIVTDAQEA